MPKKINKNLTKEQEGILFGAETEPPFSGRYYLSNDKGDYVCANCGNLLFTDKTKFESGCGWPSFFEPFDSGKSVKYKEDTSHGLRRTEVLCGNCGAHLGHLFSDAPQTPTGNRFCINSLALDFKKDKNKKSR